jgi:hypothetical protein
MDATKLTAIVGLLLALSIASERLVEIIKGLIPFLSTTQHEKNAESRRCSVLQILAVLSGVLTAFLAKDYIPIEIANAAGSWSLLGLGLLASGGSGFWNSVLTYMAEVKNLKSAQALAATNRAVNK